jgi:hypothetical protein
VANEFNSNEIMRDSGLIKPFYEYAPDIQDKVRRAYIFNKILPRLSDIPRVATVSNHILIKFEFNSPILTEFRI